MDALRPLENAIEGVHKGLPHLPAGFRKWLVGNVWWLVLISVILSVLGILSAIQAIMSLNAIGAAYYGAYNSVVAQSVAWLWLSLIASAVQVAILAVAINPLKAKQAKGWQLLFLSSLIGVVVGVLGVFFGNVFGLIGVAIGAAIGWYFLFEIRDGFVGNKKPETKKA